MRATDASGSDWTRRSARAIAAAVRSGRATAAEVVDAHLARIAQVQPEHNAFVEVWPEAARAAAAAVDATGDAGRGPLAGVPVAVKDNFAVEGQVSSCGSRMLDDWVAPYTACAVERLRAAGAVLIGRTNMDEFGMGSSTERSIHGPTRNPVDRSRTAGGSSGGSAAAVASGCVPLALGSDTGGSVRQPAAMCGIVGLKPTYGRIPRHGLVAFASSLDTVAPLARHATDLALALDVMAGDDPRDATALRDAPPSCVEALAAHPASPDTAPLRGLRVGVPEAAFGAGLEPAVASTVRAAIERMRSLGAETVPVTLPHLEHAVAVYYLTCTAEASSNLARFDGVRYGHRTAEAESLDDLIARSRSEAFGDEVKLRILLGTFGLSSGYVDAYYDKASRVRSLIRQGFEQAFTSCNLLAMPTSPFVAWPLGSMLDDPLAMYLADVLTVAPSLAGVPALSLPCGADPQGLPIGLQLVGPDRGEAELLRCAAVLEPAEEASS